ASLSDQRDFIYGVTCASPLTFPALRAGPLPLPREERDITARPLSPCESGRDPSRSDGRVRGKPDTYSPAILRARSGKSKASPARDGAHTPRSVMSAVTSRAGVTSKA